MIKNRKRTITVAIVNLIIIGIYAIDITARILEMGEKNRFRLNWLVSLCSEEVVYLLLMIGFMLVWYLIKRIHDHQILDSL